MNVARTPHDIDAAWMTAALSGSALLDGAIVAAVDFAGVGHGLMSDSFRFTLHYDQRAPRAPETLVGKFAATDSVSRETATRYAIYQTEIDFYRNVAPLLDANIPNVLFTGIDEAHQYFTLLLDDLSPARTVDQTDGGTIDDCATALRAMASIHAQCWMRKEVEAQDWVSRRRLLNENLIAALPAIGDAFLADFGSQLDGSERRAVARLIGTYPRILRDRDAAQTLQHGDFRLDNILFDVAGVPGAHILDWANISFASGLIDVAYFIGASLDQDRRSEHEEQLVRLYHDALTTGPVLDYSWEQCWTDYRRFCFLGLLTGVASPMMVERNERSDRLFLSMVHNHTRQIEALGGFSFWA